MEKRINVATNALQYLDPLIRKFIEENQQKEFSCTDEELFYDASSNDIYVSLQFTSTKEEVEPALLLTKVTLEGEATIVSMGEILEKDLEDLTHVIPLIMRQILRISFNMTKLRSTLQMSVALNTTCGDLADLVRR